ncbi:MAG: hypothetical protein WAM97_08375 [Acidimicrobiales bacterium]|jgi:hypothetical protein
MSIANIALYIAILGFLVFRRIQGRPIASVKQLMILPVIVTVLGFEDLSHKQHLGSVNIMFSVIGCAVSLALGAYRGSADKLSVRDGVSYVQWGTRSVVIFAFNIAAKLVLDVICVVSGGTTAGATSSLVLAAGLMLVGEAAVVWLRLENGPYPRLPGRTAGVDRRR